jgi:hypothetical protein
VSDQVLMQLIDLGVGFLDMFLSKVKSSVPQTVVDAVQAAADALLQHKNDLVTKANLEAQRG